MCQVEHSRVTVGVTAVEVVFSSTTTAEAGVEVQVAMRGTVETAATSTEVLASQQPMGQAEVALVAVGLKTLHKEAIAEQAVVESGYLVKALTGLFHPQVVVGQAAEVAVVNLEVRKSHRTQTPADSLAGMVGDMAAGVETDPGTVRP